jgi:hypothetical protein
MSRTTRTLCSECEGPACGGSGLCVRHLRGLALVSLDRKNWPRVRMGRRTVEGDDQWRPWLREATGEEFVALLKLLGVDPAKVSWK